MLWINGLALTACAVGFVLGWRVIRRGRQPLEAEDALLSWHETPASVFRYDKFAGLLITVHALATVTLCVLLVGSVNRAGTGPLSMAFDSPAGRWLAPIIGFRDAQVGQLSAVIAALSVGIGAFTCGAIVSFPVSRWCVRPVLVHLHPAGVIYGQSRIPWEGIASCQADRDGRLLKLFSTSNPRSPATVLHPPSDALFVEAGGTVRELLAGKEDAAARGRRRRWPAGLLVFLATFLVLLGAFWMYRYVAEWAWFLYAAGAVGYAAGGRALVHV